jgi:hypothetical protein
MPNVKQYSLYLLLISLYHQLLFLIFRTYYLRSLKASLNIPSGKESEDLPYLYWIPKLHKTPHKERSIAGSSTCSTKELSIHLTKASLSNELGLYVVLPEVLLLCLIF